MKDKLSIEYDNKTFTRIGAYKYLALLFQHLIFCSYILNLKQWWNPELGGH